MCKVARKAAAGGTGRGPESRANKPLLFNQSFALNASVGTRLIVTYIYIYVQHYNILYYSSIIITLLLLLLLYVGVGIQTYRYIGTYNIIYNNNVRLGCVLCVWVCVVCVCVCAGVRLCVAKVHHPKIISFICCCRGVETASGGR